MLVGQVLSDALRRLSLERWVEFGSHSSEKFTLEIFIHPFYMSAIGRLIEFGLQELNRENEPITVASGDDKQVLTLFSSVEDPTPAGFFEELALAIHLSVERLSSYWVASSFSANEILIREEYIEFYGNELIVYENTKIQDAVLLLRGVAQTIRCNGNVLILSITNRLRNMFDRRQHENEHPVFLVGKKEEVQAFVQLLPKISPLYHPPVFSPEETNGVSRYSMFSFVSPNREDVAVFDRDCGISANR